MNHLSESKRASGRAGQRAGHPLRPGSPVQLRRDRGWSRPEYKSGAFSIGTLSILPPDRQGSATSQQQVQEAAERGTQGSGAPLPHLAAIQSSFGRHSLSDVQAHTDAQAAEAARAMGAEAFTTGDHIAFSSSPSLQTAAHEAAHVVQQRRGVALKDGIGAVGDPYEREADEVASRVVRGQSAESLLDERRSTATAPVLGAEERSPVQRTGGPGGQAAPAQEPSDEGGSVQVEVRTREDGSKIVITHIFDKAGAETKRLYSQRGKSSLMEEPPSPFFLSLLESIANWGPVSGIGTAVAKTSSGNIIIAGAGNSPTRFRFSFRRDLEQDQYFLEAYVGFAQKASDIPKVLRHQHGPMNFFLNHVSQIVDALLKIKDSSKNIYGPGKLIPTLSAGAFITFGKGRAALSNPPTLPTAMAQIQLKLGGYVLNLMADEDFILGNTAEFMKLLERGYLDPDQLVGKIGFSIGPALPTSLPIDLTVFQERLMGSVRVDGLAGRPIFAIARFLREMERQILNYAQAGIGDQLIR